MELNNPITAAARVKFASLQTLAFLALLAAPLIAAPIFLLASSAFAATPEAQKSSSPISASKHAPANKPAAVSNPIAIEAFAALPFIDKVALSANGQYMAGLVGINGAQNIVITPIFTANPQLHALQVPDMSEVDWIRWVGDDHVIVGLRALRGVYGSDWYIERMIAVNRTTKKVTRLLWDSGGQQAAHLLHVATDGSPYILVSAQDSIYSNLPEFWPSVYRVNVSTGGKTNIQKGRTNLLQWTVDDQGRVRAGRAYQDGGTRSTLYYRPDGSSSLKAVARAKLTADEDIEMPFHFVPNSDNAYIFENDANGYHNIAELNMNSGEKIRTIYDEAPVHSVITSENGAKLLGAYIQHREKSVHWFDEAMAAHYKFLQAASPASDVDILSINADQSKMLVRFSTPDNPGLLFYFDAATQDLTRLAAMNEKLGGRRLSRAKYVHYKARDGLNIEAVLTMPMGRADKNLPLILMPHGGPWSHDRLGYNYQVQFLASLGYAVLQPNFRGSTGYGIKFEHAGRGQMGLAMQDDLTDAVRWAVEQGIADAKRVCIVGSSYGGYAAMWGIAKDPDLYRCAISINGVSSLRREVNDFGGSLHSRLYRHHWQLMSDNFNAISPIYAVNNIAAPLLLVHGKKDITVDHGQSQRMHKAMRDAGKNSIFHSVARADHYFTREADRITLLSEMEKFLRQYNPADP